MIYCTYHVWCFSCFDLTMDGNVSLGEEPMPAPVTNARIYTLTYNLSSADVLQFTRESNQLSTSQNWFCIPLLYSTVPTSMLVNNSCLMDYSIMQLLCTIMHLIYKNGIDFLYIIY